MKPVSHGFHCRLSPDAKRAQETAMPGTGAPSSLRVRPSVVGLKERVPRAEPVPVKVALDDQGRLLFLERIPLFT